MRKTGICSITIGITGTDEHVGVTHLSIMLANYLVSKVSGCGCGYESQ